MIAQIRRFLDWLEARFPAKVVVTMQAFKELGNEIAHLNSVLNVQACAMSGQAERIDVLEKSLAAIKDAIVKGHIAPLTGKEALRDEFMRTGKFPGSIPRQAVEAEV
jgi:hypothetical protein